MSDFSGRILEAIDLALEERHELEARRAAEHRQIWIEFHPLRKPDVRGNEFELHIIDLETRRCVAVRHAWLQVHYLLQELTAVMRQRLIEQARPCSMHTSRVINETGASAGKATSTESGQFAEGEKT